MPSVPLPENPSLEHLKNQAKLVQGLVANRDEGALDMVGEFHPRMGEVGPKRPPVEFRRADAQLVVARLYGFASWTRLRAHVEILDELTRPDPADIDSGDDGERFVSLACVSYNAEPDPAQRIALAHEMLEADPSLSTTSVAAMAAAGNHRLLAERIELDLAVVNDVCGTNRWSPLLYCCYSRVQTSDPDLSTLESARLLLDAGADPNVGFLWRGLLPPFTALTGAFGRGEADQPPHPDAFALARLLLEAGADPNDGQALYNNGLAGTARDDATHLELLAEFGLGTAIGGPWYRRFGSRLTTPMELLHDELEVAAHRGLANRMRFLSGLGLDLNRRVGRSRRTPWQLAEANGHSEVLEVLARSGAGERGAHDSTPS